MKKIKIKIVKKGVIQMKVSHLFYVIWIQLRAHVICQCAVCTYHTEHANCAKSIYRSQVPGQLRILCLRCQFVPISWK